jgi:branched-chain amino acid transport system ATP-binding protein
MMLEVKNLSVHYGMIKALDRVSLSVDDGEIVTIIGANGAGKSSLMGAIAGTVRRHSGEVLFLGKPLPTHSYQVTACGISLVPEGRCVFSALSVLENLQMGAYLRKHKDEIEKDLDEVFGIFPRLKERVHQSANTLSGGEQQMLAMGRALMAKPKLLMLDEPSLGLSPLLVRDIFQTIRTLHERGTAILMVEQNARQALMAAERAYVFQTGHVIKEGLAKDLLHDSEVRAAYLGKRS